MAHEDNIKQEIADTLDGIGESAFFACGRLLESVNPGQTVDPCGPIKLSLQEMDASQIIAASHQAPSRRGSDTIIDTTIRRTWELGQDHLSMRNIAALQTVVDKALEMACSSLGIVEETGGTSSNIKAELYKLLLYEKGALFRPNTNIEKTPGMVSSFQLELNLERATTLFHSFGTHLYVMGSVRQASRALRFYPSGRIAISKCLKHSSHFYSLLVHPEIMIVQE